MDPTTFTKNRERLPDADVDREFLSRIVKQACEKGSASDEHFTVDETLIEAWTSLKSFQRKDQDKAEPPDGPGNPTVNLHGGSARIRRTSPTPMPMRSWLGRGRQGSEAETNTELFEANGTAERDAALIMLEQIPGAQRVTVAGDKGYDTKEFRRRAPEHERYSASGAKQQSAGRERD
jgi:hypothetical protein